MKKILYAYSETPYIQCLQGCMQSGTSYDTADASDTGDDAGVDLSYSPFFSTSKYIAHDTSTEWTEESPRNLLISKRTIITSTPKKDETPVTRSLELDDKDKTLHNLRSKKIKLRK